MMTKAVIFTNFILSSLSIKGKFPKAHRIWQVLSFKDEDFCFCSFKGKNWSCAIPKDEDFCLSRTVFEIYHVEFRRPSLKDKNLRL